MKLALFFVSLAVFICGVQSDCCIITEISKVLEKAIRQFVPDKAHHDTYVGCMKAFLIGDSSKCDPKKFRLPQAKSCENVIQHTDLKAKCKKHNTKSYRSMIDNAIYSQGADAEEICEKLVVEGSKLLAKIKTLQANDGKRFKELYAKICKNDAEKCKDMKEMPAELEHFIFGDMCKDFANLIKIWKNTFKSKAAPSCSAITQGVELMFGGGAFGMLCSECAKQGIVILTKFSKSFSG